MYAVGEGTIVGDKYRVDYVLGSGGMGVVVAATHLQLDQVVALKFLVPRDDMDPFEPGRVARFLREARAVVRLKSEHVARVYDVGMSDEGAPYIVMEYLEGRDLAAHLRAHGPMSVAEASELVLQACEAVAEAHALGIVHRDLKPANLFLTRGPLGVPLVKVLDFGISKMNVLEPDTLPSSSDAPRSRAPALTQTGSSVLGTPGYVAPEQARRESTVDARADVFSLGCALYTLVTRKVPFDGSLHQMLGVSAEGSTATWPKEYGAHIPDTFRAVIDRATQSDPGRRYAHVADLAAALAPFVPERGGVSLERIEATLGFTTRGAPKAVAPVASRAPRRGALRIVAGSAALVIALAVGAFASRALETPDRTVSARAGLGPAVTATAPGPTAAASAAASEPRLAPTAFEIIEPVAAHPDAAAAPEPAARASSPTPRSHGSPTPARRHHSPSPTPSSGIPDSRF